MSYLYNILMEFYSKLLEYYDKNPKEFFTIGKPNYCERDISSIFYNIINNRDNYFHMFYHYFVIEFCDIDFFADHVESGVYIYNPKFYHRNGDVTILEEYYEHENNNLFRTIHESVYTRRLMTSFVQKMRRYYLDDFLKHRPYDETVDEVKKLYNKLSFSFRHLNLIKPRATYEEILEMIKEQKYEILDKCSELIDSNRFRQAIVNQQEYYISEIERLENIINEKGNITNLKDEVFGLYIDFLHKFKQEAILKKDKLKKEIERVKTLKLV